MVPGTDLLQEKCSRLHTQAQVRSLLGRRRVFSWQRAPAIIDEAVAVKSPDSLILLHGFLKQDVHKKRVTAGPSDSNYRAREQGQADRAKADRVRGCDNQASGPLGPAVRGPCASGTASCE